MTVPPPTDDHCLQVGSILTGVILLVGPLASLLVNKFGARVTCILGAIISALAIFVSTFSVNVYMLMVFYGVLGGLGLGFMYVPAVTAVGYWFEKRRSGEYFAMKRNDYDL